MAANPATECATSWVRSSGKSKAKVVALTKDVALSASWDSVSMLRIDTLPWDPVSLWGIGVGSCFVLLSPSQRVKSSLKPAVDWLKGGAKLAGALDDVISSALLDHG